MNLKPSFVEIFCGLCQGFSREGQDDSQAVSSDRDQRLVNRLKGRVLMRGEKNMGYWCDGSDELVESVLLDSSLDSLM